MRDSCQCEEGLPRASVWLEGVLLPLTGVLGLGGNGLAVMVFRSVRSGRQAGSWESSFRKFQSQRSTFSLLLTVLAIVDILCIITFLGKLTHWNNISYSTLHAVDYSILKVWDLTLSNKFLLYVSAYVWFPVKNVLLTFESYLILAISLERYLAVCR